MSSELVVGIDDRDFGNNAGEFEIDDAGRRVIGRDAAHWREVYRR